MSIAKHSLNVQCLLTELKKRIAGLLPHAAISCETDDADIIAGNLEYPFSTHMVITIQDAADLGAALGVKHPLAVRADEAIYALRDATFNKYRAAAKQMVCDGELEVDDGAVVSDGAEDGAYVAAWVWVYKTDAGITPEEPES